MRGGKREGAGRPTGSTKPSNLKMRSMRLTNTEYSKVKEFIKQLRESAKMKCPNCNSTNTSKVDNGFRLPGWSSCLDEYCCLECLSKWDEEGTIIMSVKND